MGRCHEFGSQIREGCGHPMRAGELSCACPECGVVCQGLFDGCSDVWARGPRSVTLSMASVIDPPRLRALAAGPDPATAAVAAPTPPSTNGVPNGATNSNGAGPGGPPPPRSEPSDPTEAKSAGSRTEVLQWFEDAFGELRNELHAVVSTVTRQQAMLAELLDSREAELRVVMVAESLPELAGEAAARALADQSDGLSDVVGAALDDFRASMAAADLSNVGVMDGMRELLRRVELTAELNTEAAHDDGDARLDALKASVSRQLRPLSAALVELAKYIDSAEEREEARARSLKASVTRQVQPLATAVHAAVERTDEQLAEIRARLDALGAPKARAPRTAPSKAAPSKKVASPRKAASAKQVAPAATPRAVAKKRRASPEPEVTVLYDYEPPPTQPVPGLLLRRRQARPGA